MESSSHDLRADRRSLVVLLALSMAVAFAVRVPFFFWPLTVDEAGYAYGARWWFDGLTLYSDDLWFDRPQGIFLAYEAGMAFLGGSTEAIRIIGAVWAMGTTACVAVIADRMFDRHVAWVAGIGFGVISAAPAVEGFVANAEVFMLLPATAAVLLIWSRKYGAAGVLTGIAVLLKPSAVPVVLFAAIWMFNDREDLRTWIRFGVGASVAPLAAVLHGVLTVGLYEYVYATALFRLEVGSNASPLIHLIVGWYLTAPVWIPLVLITIPGWRAMGPTRERLFVGVWMVTALLGMAMGGNWFQHYMLQLLPPLTVVAAASLVYISGEVTSNERWRARVPAGVIAAGFLGLVGPWLLYGPTEGADRLFTGMPGYAINERLGAHLEANTTPDETVYVAIGHADVLYLSDRRSPVPFLYPQQVAERDASVEVVLESLGAREPAFVVVIHRQLQKIDEGGRIGDALAAGYQHDRWFGEVELLRRRSEVAAR